MDPQHKQWNEQQQALRKALTRPAERTRAVELFLRQHAMIHAAAISGSGQPSFEDEVWDGLVEAHARAIHPKFEHSIVWCFWHLARCEDISMNLLTAGTSQVLLAEGWCERMRVPARDTGNAMRPDEMSAFSQQIDIPALRGYRQSVGRCTREIVRALRAEDFKRRVDPVRLAQVQEQGAVLPSEQWLLDYWSGLTIAGLLLMPPTRHSSIHINEALRIKQRLQRVLK